MIGLDTLQPFGHVFAIAVLEHLLHRQAGQLQVGLIGAGRLEFLDDGEVRRAEIEVVARFRVQPVLGLFGPVFGNHDAVDVRLALDYAGIEDELAGDERGVVRTLGQQFRQWLADDHGGVDGQFPLALFVFARELGHHLAGLEIPDLAVAHVEFLEDHLARGLGVLGMDRGALKSRLDRGSGFVWLKRILSEF